MTNINRKCALGVEDREGMLYLTGEQSAYMPTHSFPAAGGVLNTDLELYNFFTLSPDLFCIADRQGYFRKVTPAFTQLLGWSEDELLAAPFVHLVHPDDREATLQMVRDQAAGRDEYPFRNRYRTKEGAYVWLSWTATTSRGNGLFYAMAKDVTREREQENQLLLQQDRIKRANYLARLGSWEMDIATGHIWASEELYDLYEISRHDFPVITPIIFMQWVHPEDRAFVEGQVASLKVQDHQFYEHRLLLHTGKLIYVQQLLEVKRENGVPVRINGIVQDISKRKESDLRLELSEQRFRSLVQHSYDMICILDLEGNYLYTSDSMEHNLGYKSEELAGVNALTLVHPDDLFFAQQSILRLHTEKLVRDLPPFRFRCKSGSWHWIESVGTNLVDDPAVGGIVVNARDVTDRKMLQEKLAREVEERRITINKAAIRAQEREREQLGRELHDNVNQVLTTVKLYTELVLDGTVTDSAVLMQKSVGYLTDCINEIRNISKRLSTPTLGKITLGESLQELVTSLSLAGKLTINLQVGRMEKKKLSQDVHLGIYRIVQEHLTNVLRHAGATRVDISLETARGQMEVLITDNGRGFDVAARRKGIGISNMYGRCENINGRMELVSAPGKGCTLKLQVPA